VTTLVNTDGSARDPRKKTTYRRSTEREIDAYDGMTRIRAHRIKIGADLRIASVDASLEVATSATPDDLRQLELWLHERLNEVGERRRMG
jgi:hypothetical protein